MTSPHAHPRMAEHTARERARAFPDRPDALLIWAQWKSAFRAVLRVAGLFRKCVPWVRSVMTPQHPSVLPVSGVLWVPYPVLLTTGVCGSVYRTAKDAPDGSPHRPVEVDSTAICPPDRASPVHHAVPVTDSAARQVTVWWYADRSRLHARAIPMTAHAVRLNFSSVTRGARVPGRTAGNTAIHVMTP